MAVTDLLPELTGDKYYHTKKWTQRHRMCVALEMAGFKPGEIAGEMDFTISKVSHILGDPRAQHERDNALAEISDVSQTIVGKLEKASHDAFDEVEELMSSSPKDDIRLRAALSILDRAGYTPIRKEINMNVEVPSSPESVRAMKRTLLEASGMNVSYNIDAKISNEPSGDMSSSDPKEIIYDSEAEEGNSQLLLTERSEEEE